MWIGGAISTNICHYHDTKEKYLRRPADSLVPLHCDGHCEKNLKICREQWRSNLDSIILTFSSAIWLASKPMQNMEYDIARFIVKSDN